MKIKTWINYFFILSFLFIGCGYLYNYLIDSYGIFRKDYSILKREPNQNFIKMNYLINNSHSFNSFIFGSSRVGSISPQNISNGNYYNMTYSSGVPFEHYENIKLLLKKNIKIKNIMIGLDEFSYQIDPFSHLTIPLTIPHYETDINKMSKFHFYFNYLSLKPSINSFRILINQLLHNENYSYELDLYNTGMPLIPQKVEEFIEKHPKEHSNNKKFLIPTSNEGNRIDRTIETMLKIKTLCVNHDINLVLFINPIHKVTYINTDFENFLKFKYLLSQIQSFYDFSGLNSITTSNYYYYDTSHYRRNVGSMIKAKIFSDSSVDVPEDFGVFVTKDSIDHHIQILREQLQSYDTNKSLNLK